MKKRLLLIDTFNFLHRAYHAIPRTLSDSDGNPINAVYGVASMLISVFGQVKPDYVVAAVDSEKPTFRVEDFTGYKAHRKPMEEDLSVQIPKMLKMLDAFGIKWVQVNGYEADDIIGTLVQKFAGKNCEVVMVSNDKDLWQLLNKNTVVMSPAKKGNVNLVGYDDAKKLLGFSPELLVDYKALRGDPSDNIPGVYGIGDKTATSLVKKYETVEKIYKNISKVEPNSLKEKLANNAEDAAMSKHLASIVTNVPVDIRLGDCIYAGFDRSAVKEVLTEYNFVSLIKRLGFEGGEKESNPDQLNLL